DVVVLDRGDVLQRFRVLEDLCCGGRALVAVLGGEGGVTVHDDHELGGRIGDGLDRDVVALVVLTAFFDLEGRVQIEDGRYRSDGPSDRGRGVADVTVRSDQP